jgi:hypothetical protein
MLETVDLFRVQISRETMNGLVEIVPRNVTDHTFHIRTTNTGLITTAI